MSISLLSFWQVELVVESLDICICVCFLMFPYCLMSTTCRDFAIVCALTIILTQSLVSSKQSLTSTSSWCFSSHSPIVCGIKFPRTQRIRGFTARSMKHIMTMQKSLRKSVTQKTYHLISSLRWPLVRFYGHQWILNPQDLSTTVLKRVHTKTADNSVSLTPSIEPVDDSESAKWNKTSKRKWQDDKPWRG